jgi:hypothetical protein
MMLYTASLISAILSYLMACKMRHQNEEIDDNEYWAPQPRFREQYGY